MIFPNKLLCNYFKLFKNNDMLIKLFGIKLGKQNRLFILLFLFLFLFILILININ